MILVKRKHDVPLKLEWNELTNQCIRNISFHRCIIDNFDFCKSFIDNVDFRCADAHGIRMRDAIIQDSIFILVDGMGGDYARSKFYNTNLLHSDLRNSVFEGADLRGAVFKYTNLESCNFKGADLGANDFDNCNLNKVVYDANTKWKSGFKPETMGAVFL